MEKRIKTIHSVNKLEFKELVNGFLKDKTKNIIDIKYTTYINEESYFSATIIYEEKEEKN